MDPLDGLLRHFSVSANLIHSGPLCGDSPTVLDGDKGHLHVIKQGCADVRHANLPPLYITEPTLLFYPRPLEHSFRTSEDPGADFVCATVAFTAGRLNPIVRALPSMIAIRLADAPEMQSTLDLLFAEASEERHGRRAAVGRLFEVLVTLVLRKIVNDGTMSGGMLAGLSHPQLGRALVALHDAPERTWTLETLAAEAGMSRSRFAQVFRTMIGTTVGEYLMSWRVGIAQELLRRATPLKQVATRVGYGSALALTRVFRARMGMTPHAWLEAETAAHLP